MSKIVRKLILDDLWNIGRNECWFSDMAGKGLHLKSIGRTFAAFEKTEPSQTKYRIDVLSESPSQEQLDIYQEYGWDFVSSKGDFHIFSSPEARKAPELHTDPAEQSYSLEKLNKHLEKILIIISILMLAFFGMMFSIFFLDKTPFLMMVKGQFVQQMILLLINLYFFYKMIKNYWSLRALKKSLAEGKPIDHKENWRKKRYINGALNILLISIAMITIAIPFIAISKSETYTLAEYNINFPVVRLNTLEQNPGLQRELIYNSNGVDWGNQISYDWSILAPLQFELDEHGIVKGEYWEDKSGEYSPSIHTQYYQLAFSKMTNGLIGDLMERYSYYDPDRVPQKIESPIFDQVYVTVDGIEKELFASWENNVIYIRYYGNEDIDRILSRASEIVS